MVAHIQSDTKHDPQYWANVWSASWADISPALGQRRVFARLEDETLTDREAVKQHVPISSEGDT